MGAAASSAGSGGATRSTRTSSTSPGPRRRMRSSCARIAAVRTLRPRASACDRWRPIYGLVRAPGCSRPRLKPCSVWARWGRWTVRCSLQAQGARQPLDGDLEAAPGPDGQRDQEQVERHAESQGRGAGPCRPCKVLAWGCRSSRHPGPCHPGLLGLALSALGRRSALWRSARASRS